MVYMNVFQSSPFLSPKSLIKKKIHRDTFRLLKLAPDSSSCEDIALIYPCLSTFYCELDELKAPSTSSIIQLSVEDLSPERHISRDKLVHP
jgi:hypothetical protein